MVVLFIYNINHIANIGIFYRLFNEYNPRSGIIIPNPDLKGNKYGFTTINNTDKWKDYNGLWIKGDRVYFSLSKKNYSMKNKNDNIIKNKYRCNGICKNGKQCSRRIENGLFCWQHGGNRNNNIINKMNNKMNILKIDDMNILVLHVIYSNNYI